MNPFIENVEHENTHKFFEALYLEYVNNFLSVEGFARYYGFNVDHAKIVLEIGKQGSIWK